MELICKQINPGPCKTYLISNDTDNNMLLIDPVIEHVQDYRQLLIDNNLKLIMVIDTHTHADHISAGASLKDMFDCEYAMHKKSPVKCASFSLEDGFSWKLFNKIPVSVLYSPGHTKDSISLVFPEWIFTGDALFLDDGGAGRDDLPGGDPTRHWETLQKISKLPEHLIVYPAHDYRDRTPSTLKKQKKSNPHLKKCNEGKEEFVQYLEDLKLGPADWMKDVLKANYACAQNPKAAWIPVDSSACEVKGTIGTSANEVMISSIPPFILKQKLNDDKSIVLLDVREKEELDGMLGHIHGIIHIPIGKLASRLNELSQYSNREIITVCRSGGRAYTAAQILNMSGFKKVLVLEGGMMGWNSI